MATVDVESSLDQREVSPGLRARFVARATTLVGEVEFRTALHEQRKDWNKRWSSHPIGSHEPPPSHPTTLLGVVLPRSLSKRSSLALWDWLETVGNFCLQFWPPRCYPSYSPAVHPSAAFVSACLIYDENLVSPDEYISFHGWGPRWLPFDPTDVDRIPEVKVLRARCEALEAELALALQEDLAELGRAHERVRQQVESVDAAQQANAPSWWGYVPLLPGMNRKDWEDMGPRAVREIERRFGDDIVRDEILRLTADGMSTERIAKLVGVTARQVTIVRSENRRASPKPSA
jgi:hypothetical protein